MPGPAVLTQPTFLDQLRQVLQALSPWAAPAAAAVAPFAPAAAAGVATGALVAPSVYLAVNPEARAEFLQDLAEKVATAEELARRYTPWGKYAFPEPVLPSIAGGGVYAIPWEQPLHGLEVPTDIPRPMPMVQAPPAKALPLEVPVEPLGPRATAGARARVAQVANVGARYGGEPQVAAVRPAPEQTAQEGLTPPLVPDLGYLPDVPPRAIARPGLGEELRPPQGLAAAPHPLIPTQAPSITLRPLTPPQRAAENVLTAAPPATAAPDAGSSQPVAPAAAVPRVPGETPLSEEWRAALAQMPAIPEGYKRLYRVGQPPTDIPSGEAFRPWFEQLDWPAQEAVATGALRASGRWFTDSPDDVRWYLEQEYFDQPTVRYLDIPERDAQQYRVSNLPQADAPARYSRRPEHEFFLPPQLAREAAALAALTPLTAEEARSYAPQAYTQQPAVPLPLEPAGAPPDWQELEQATSLAAPLEVPAEPTALRATPEARARVAAVRPATGRYGDEPVVVAPASFVRARDLPPLEVAPDLVPRAERPALPGAVPQVTGLEPYSQTVGGVYLPASARDYAYAPTEETAPALREPPYAYAPAAEVGPALRELPYTYAPSEETAPALRELPYTYAPTQEVAPALRQLPYTLAPTQEIAPVQREAAYTYAPAQEIAPTLRELPYRYAPAEEVAPALRELPYTYAPPQDVAPALRELPYTYAPTEEVAPAIRPTPYAYAPTTEVAPALRQLPYSYAPPQEVAPALRELPYTYAPAQEMAPALRAAPYTYAPTQEVAPALRQLPYTLAPTQEAVPALRELPYTYAPTAEVAPAIRATPYSYAPTAEVTPALRATPYTLAPSQEVAPALRAAPYTVAPAEEVAPAIRAVPYTLAPPAEVTPAIRPVPYTYAPTQEAVPALRTTPYTYAPTQEVAPAIRTTPYTYAPTEEAAPAIRTTPYTYAPTQEAVPAIRATPYTYAPTEEVAPAIRAKPYTLAPVEEVAPAIRTPAIPASAEAAVVPPAPWQPPTQAVIPPGGGNTQPAPTGGGTAATIAPTPPQPTTPPGRGAAGTTEEPPYGDEDWRDITAALAGDERSGQEMNAWLAAFRAEHEGLNPWDVGPGDQANNFIDHLLAYTESTRAAAAGTPITRDWWEQAYQQRYGLAPGQERPPMAPFELAINRLGGG